MCCCLTIKCYNSLMTKGSYTSTLVTLVIIRDSNHFLCIAIDNIIIVPLMTSSDSRATKSMLLATMNALAVECVHVDQNSRIALDHFPPIQC